MPISGLELVTNTRLCNTMLHHIIICKLFLTKFLKKFNLLVCSVLQLAFQLHVFELKRIAVFGLNDGRNRSTHVVERRVLAEQLLQGAFNPPVAVEAGRVAHHHRQIGGL